RSSRTGHFFTSSTMSWIRRKNSSRSSRSGFRRSRSTSLRSASVTASVMPCLRRRANSRASFSVSGFLMLSAIDGPFRTRFLPYTYNSSFKPKRYNTRKLKLKSPRPLPPRPLRHPHRPLHDAVLQLGVRHLILACADAPAHGNPGRVHGVGIAGEERVPPVGV